MKNKRIINRDFFTNPAEELAPLLLGKILCRKISDGNILRFRLIETEAYPSTDTACHANKYKTGNAVITQNMIGGTLYVHYKNKKYPGSSFDIVSGIENCGEGVLIRGGINIDNPNEKYLSRPRLLGEALKIDYEELNRIDLCNPEQQRIWLEEDDFVIEGKLMEPQKRIGLDKAKNICNEDKNRLLRFDLDVRKM